MGSARLKMDQQRVASALDTPTASAKKEDPKKTALFAPTWQISAAAGISAFECVTHSDFLSALVLVGVVFSAWRDPVDDEGLLGAVSRLFQAKVEPES
ncbi:MAG: hypothetical protein SGBAC_007978 [Bacillariaceae sp.]